MKNITNTFFGLFKSKTRNLLLLNFFLNPEKEFYTRELSRKLKSSVGNVANELKRIEAAGLIVTRQVGNILLYQANKQSPVFKEIKEIIIKIIGVEALIKPFFDKMSEIKVAFIYGSYARGDFDHASDIDLFVIVSKDSVKTYGKISTELSCVEEKTGRVINMDYMTEEEFAKRQKRKNPYMQDLLQNKIIFIKGEKNDFRLPTGQ